MTLQRHKHKPTCYKGRKNKKICRFNYPIYVMNRTMILKPLSDDEITGNENVHIEKIKTLMNTYFNSNTDITFENMLEELSMTEYEYINAIRSTLKRNKIFLERSSMEVAINAYNLEILMLLESNMNLQKVLDAYIAAFYMVNYVTKIEAGLSKLLREASDDIENGNLDLKQKLRKIANVFINGNALTSQEAV